MKHYTAYLDDIGTRKAQGLNPKPIDEGALVEDLIAIIKDSGNETPCRRAAPLHLQHPARYNERGRREG